MTMVREMIPCGELRDGDIVVNYCMVRWMRRGGGCIAFGPTNEDSQQQVCFPLDLEVWVERNVLTPTLYQTSPIPHAVVHR